MSDDIDTFLEAHPHRQNLFIAVTILICASVIAASQLIAIYGWNEDGQPENSGVGTIVLHTGCAPRCTTPIAWPSSATPTARLRA